MEILSQELNLLSTTSSFRISKDTPLFMMLENYQLDRPFKIAPSLYQGKFSIWTLLPTEIDVVALVHGDNDLPVGFKLELAIGDTFIGQAGERIDYP